MSLRSPAFTHLLLDLEIVVEQNVYYPYTEKQS